MSTNARIVKVRDGAVAAQQIDGETVLLDLEHSVYLGVNESGTALWPALVSGTTRDDLVALLVARFGVDDARACADVDSFLEQCRSRDLLER